MLLFVNTAGWQYTVITDRAFFHFSLLIAHLYHCKNRAKVDGWNYATVY